MYNVANVPMPGTVPGIDSSSANMVDPLTFARANQNSSVPVDEKNSISLDWLKDAHEKFSRNGGIAFSYPSIGGSDSSSDPVNQDYMSYIEGLFSSVGEQNELNRIYNAEQARLNREFNAMEAEKTRIWSEKMSSTSYQRAVEDLQKAGLNPILAYQQGGASTPSSASASGSNASYNVGGGDTFTDLLQSFANLLSSAGGIFQFLSLDSKLKSVGN